MPEYIWGFACYFEVWSNTMMIYIFIVSTLWLIFEFLSYCYTLFLHSALFSVLNLTFRAQQWDFSVFWCNTLLWNFTVGQWMWDVHRDSLLLFHWKQKLTNWNLEFWIKNIKKNTFFWQGTGCEMYTETLSSSFIGMSFAKAAEICFVKVRNYLFFLAQMIYHSWK